MRTAIPALLVVAAVLGAASCRDGGTGPGEVRAGEFRATVSGHASGEFTGTAHLYEGDSFLPGRQIVLTSRDGEVEITLWGGGLLSTGTDFDFEVGRHPVGVLANVQAALSINPQSTVGPLYIAREGTLRVTSSTAERVSGQFTFDGVVHLPDGSTRVAKVSGAFNAVPGPTWDGTRHAPHPSPVRSH
ncbi:MAG: hypothetical protein KY467_10805 [Gemmatimonadetes bacterium]|nr:hypothetical protein [Gemmatimonadota bacterium]